jgi:hypothetical protein
MPTLNTNSSFSHSAAEAALPPRHRPIHAERFKTKICENYEKHGFCPYEDRCMFAHGAHELRTPETNVAYGLVTEGSINAFVTGVIVARCIANGSAGDSAVLLQQFQADCCHQQNTILAERFKTKLCASFARYGTCQYGAQCMFAHDAAELRSTRMNLHDNLVTLEAVRAFQHLQGADELDNDEGRCGGSETRAKNTSERCPRRKSKRRGGRRVQEHRRAAAARDSPVLPPPRMPVPQAFSDNSSLTDHDVCTLDTHVVREPETPASMFCAPSGCGSALLRRVPYQHNPYAARIRPPVDSQHAACLCSMTPTGIARGITATPTASVWTRSICGEGAVSFDDEASTSHRQPHEKSPLAEVMGCHQLIRFGVKDQPEAGVHRG